MIVCPNCNHSNSDGSIQCEACYTPLPVQSSCPSCGAQVQSEASFCGHCGVDLKTALPLPPGDSRAAQPQPAPVPADALPQTWLPVSETTRLQSAAARLLHVQTATLVEFPQGLGIIRIGKPNQRVAPDIDVAGFPHAEVVSRVHATVRVEAGVYYIEDTGSSNGTYINNLPLPPGNRHRLQDGDRIALGKEDKVSFIFQNSG